MRRVSHKQNSLFGYQGQEKPADGTLWDQFELRLYNHDLGRWFAPDPYNQFHSPYIGMANNPVSAVDPDGGYSMFDDQGMHFYGKDKLEEDRALGRGHYSRENLTKEYEERYNDLANRYGIGKG